MKCVDLEEKINLMLDGEANPLQTKEIKAHLATCQNCQSEFNLRRTAQTLLKKQPVLVPNSAFDNQMLQGFENRQKAKAAIQKNWFTNLFHISNPVLRFGFAATIFAVGFGLAFLLGRSSVSSTPHLTVSQSDTVNMEIRKDKEQLQTLSPEVSKNEKVLTPNEVKIVTKYIKVPVVKEKIIEKPIYIIKQPQFLWLQEKKTLIENANKEQEKIANQFNLKDLQPVSTVSYKIIRKGENINE